jgi:hypothetical protein
MCGHRGSARQPISQQAGQTCGIASLPAGAVRTAYCLTYKSGDHSRYTALWKSVVIDGILKAAGMVSFGSVYISGRKPNKCVPLCCE